MKVIFNTHYLLFFCSIFFIISSCKNLQKTQKTPIPPRTTISSSNLQQLKGGKMVEYMTEEAGEVLILKDDLEPFFEELGDLELEIRLKDNFKENDRAANIQQFKDQMKASVQEWKADELTFVKEIFEEAYSLCSQVTPELFPKNLQLILTDGTEENNAFYTRDAAIIIPRPTMQRMNNDKGRERFLQTMIHEVFHVYSRLNPEKQHQLYETIGYEKIENLDIGSMLQKRKLTNPDGVDYRFKINVVKSNGDAVPTILMIYSKHDEFTSENGSFFQYLAYDLFEIEAVDNGWQVVNGDEPTPLGIQKVSGFREQIGNNTDYIIHPDEVLADNVAILVMSKKTGKLPSRVDENGKGLLDKIERILRR
ncbi:MAG: hypothetical protein ACPGVB_09365 [Chitinophagales bacterium]